MQNKRTHLYTRFIVLFVALLTINSYSQDAKQDILRITETYSKYPNLSMNIAYNLFKNYSATVPSETELGSFQQQGNLRYNKLKQIESIQNKEYLLVIDNEEKMIVVGNPVKVSTTKITLLDLDHSLAICSSVNYTDVNAKQGSYKLTFKQNIVSEYDAVELYFNKKSFLLEKMVYYYREKIRINQYDETSPKEKPKLEITFSKIKFEKISDPAFFSETRFIEKKKGKYVPSGVYQEYSILDQKIAK